jgi:hypothetical protein
MTASQLTTSGTVLCQLDESRLEYFDYHLSKQAKVKDKLDLLGVT